MSINSSSPNVIQMASRSSPHPRIPAEMSPFPCKNQDELEVELVLGEWSYRRIFKQHVSIETEKNEQEEQLATASRGGRQEAPRPATDEEDEIRRIPAAVVSYQNIFHGTEQEVQYRNQQSMATLKGRHPHRARLINSFARPWYMPNRLFFDCLWNAIQTAERQLCEDHLGAKPACEYEGGYRKAFASLQALHGMEFMDNLLREEVRVRWVKVESFHNGALQSYLKGLREVRKFGQFEVVQSPQIKPLGSRRVDNPDKSRKRVKFSELQATTRVPQPLKDKTNRHNSARLPIHKAYQKSGLRREIVYHN